MEAAGHTAPAEFVSASAIPATTVEVSVSCRNLADLDVFSKSDPMVVLFEKDTRGNVWRESNRTEIVWNNLNPDFVKKFVMQYHFEECQKVKFEVYDVDSKSPDLQKHDFCGKCETTLGEIVSSGQLRKNLIGGPAKTSGAIILTAEEVTSCKDEISLEFVGCKLDKKDFFGLSDPFLSFLRTNEDGSRMVCYRTEAIKNTLNPKWRRFRVPVRLLCNGDLDRELRVECYDWNRSGDHSIIGEFAATVRQFSEWPNGTSEFPLRNPKKTSKRSYKNSGIIKLVFAKVEEVPSFLDYIKGGTELNCTFAIDFTASNGNPQQAGTLHYINPYQPTQYAIALQAVGEIIQDYDSDNMFPTLGFGAKLPPNGQISHCFPLSGDPSNPFCHGIQGVMDAYHRSVQSVQLYGPTNFSPIINHVAGFARQHQDGRQYFILLMLTDGIITDFELTKRAIVEASSLPISIIIIGVGDAEFDAMDELDGDDVRVSYQGKYAARDIVQFVPFRDFFEHMVQGNVNVAKHLLAKEVLAEIPAQIVSYMQSKGIKPLVAEGRVNRGAPVASGVPHHQPGAQGGYPTASAAPPPYPSHNQPPPYSYR